MLQTLFTRLCLLACLLAFLVVILGAYVRLSNAGLGCPDWPGCYGHLTVPSFEKAQASHPDSPLVSHKAWKEMVHRYLAGSLGLLILALAILSLRRGPSGERASANNTWRTSLLAWFLVVLVIFQALLGMWTVTLKLHPLVVMAHLLGGLATLGLLWWMALKQFLPFFPLPRGEGARRAGEGRLRPWAILGLILLILQIVLGGWVSANYASLACPDFPTCQGHWWPPMNFGEAFHLLREVGLNYEGGVLDNPARMTIHWMHRLGAILVFLYLGFLGGMAIRRGGSLRKVGLVLLMILVIQISLGISNILFFLPLGVATAHNAGAALLLLSLLALIQALPSPRRA